MEKISRFSFMIAVVLCLVIWTTAEGHAQKYNLTVINTGAGQGTVTSSPSGIKCGPTCSAAFPDGKKVTLKTKPDSDSSFAGWAGGGCTGIDPCSVVMDSDVTVTGTFDLMTPKMSLSTDSLEFSYEKAGQKVTQTLVMSNIGTGNLIVTVSGIDGTDFSISGKSTFVVKPNKNYNLKVTYHAPSSGTPAPGAQIILSTNDPENGKVAIDLEALSPLVIPSSATVSYHLSIHFASHCSKDNVTMEEKGDFPIHFVYSKDKNSYIIWCSNSINDLEGNNWCEGTTDAYAHYVCANKCTDDAFQNGIQWIIYGELSKDKSTLTLQFYHANEPFGKWIITCPNSQPTVLPWGLHGANVFLPEIVMPYADKASKTIPFGDLGEVTFTIKFAVN